MWRPCHFPLFSFSYFYCVRIISLFLPLAGSRRSETVGNRRNYLFPTAVGNSRIQQLTLGHRLGWTKVSTWTSSRSDVELAVNSVSVILC